MAESRKVRQPTAKYLRRLEEIRGIASDLINLHGTSGLTLSDVARALDLDTSSVTYYFKKKELLAASCFDRTLDVMDETVSAGEKGRTPQERVRLYLRESFGLYLRQRRSGANRLAILSDMRALDGDIRAPLDDKVIAVFNRVAGFFDDNRSPQDAGDCANIVISNAFWIFGWLDNYREADIDRAYHRLCEIFEHGICPDRVTWARDVFPLEEGPEDNDAQRRFLHAATKRINAQGYKGASVENIAADLGVTIGSFYHHLDNKDDLVAACCDRSFELVETAQDLAVQAGGTGGDQLGRQIATLMHHQYYGQSPLLRMSAFQALPMGLRERMYARASQEAAHVAGLISDGQRDGTVVAVDPAIASQVVMTTINAAVDVRHWSDRLPTRADPVSYADKLLHGLYRAEI